MANPMPWSKFFWSDWKNDPNLCRCSKAAKGFWIDCLALMYECEDRGVLSTGCEPWSDDDIAAAVCGDSGENLSCLHELVAKGVAHRNESGAVYSRRMVRDEEVRKAKAKAGSKGGKQKRSKTEANYEAKHKQTLSDSDSNSDSPEGGSAEGGSAFDAFWAEYPRKSRIAHVRRLWASMGLDSKAGEVMDGLARCKASAQWSKDGGKFVPGVSRWLEDEGWHDHPDPSPARKLDPLADKSKAELDGLYALACEHWPDCRAQGRGSDYTRSRMAKLARGAA